MKAGAGQQERQPLCCDTKRLGSAHCAETTHLLVQRPCPAGGAADHASARSTAPTRTCERHVMRADARAMRGEKPRFPFDAQDLDEALKDHAVNGRSSPWPNKRGHHFFMAVLRSFLALCVLGEAFGTLLNFSENDQFVGKTDNMRKNRKLRHPTQCKVNINRWTHISLLGIKVSGQLEIPFDSV